jgi:type IV secretory pathway TrbF-like protein
MIRSSVRKMKPYQQKFNRSSPLSGHTWQVDWHETATSQNGDTSDVSNWQADITIALHAPTDAATIIANPMGIYVVNFSRTKRL